MYNYIYKIQIDDITVRCYDIKDAAKVKEAIDSSLDHLHEFMIWSHADPETIGQKEARIKKWQKNFSENTDFTYGIFRGEKLLGSTGLHTRIGEKALEIGYWVRQDELNKGIATKVSLALTIAAFEYIKIGSVEIHHNPKNIVSSIIPQKLNFQKMPNYSNNNEEENCRWLMTKENFLNNKELLKKLYNRITFYNKENEII